MIGPVTTLSVTQTLRLDEWGAASGFGRNLKDVLVRQEGSVLFVDFEVRGCEGRLKTTVIHYLSALQALDDLADRPWNVDNPSFEFFSRSKGLTRSRFGA